MNSQTYKRIARKLKGLWAELENEGLSAADFDFAQNEIRQVVLEQEGFTLEEYTEAGKKASEERKAKAEIAPRVQEMSLLGVETVTLKGDKGDAPTDEELLALIKPLIPEPVPGKTPTNDELLSLIKPLIPVVKDGETPSDKRLLDLIAPLVEEVQNSVHANVGYLENKIETAKAEAIDIVRREIPIVDVPALKGELLNTLEVEAKKQIDIMGMPDFRKLGMGLREDVDRLLNNPSGGGYTNLTEFVDQTAWRLFYSNGSGDVTELALGANGEFLKSNGASAIPSWTSAGGSGITRTVVVTSGSATMGETASTDYIYFVAGAHTMSLPAANTNRYTVKNNHSAAITIDTVGAETIDGAASISIAPEDAVDLASDGTNWFVI